MPPWSPTSSSSPPCSGVVVGRRVNHRDAVDDIVQETLARLLAARQRLDDRATGPLRDRDGAQPRVSGWRQAETGRRQPAPPRSTTRAPRHPTRPCSGGRRRRPSARRWSGSHHGERARSSPTRSRGGTPPRWPTSSGSTPGAVAAQLNRSWAKLRVEYLLELERPPPTAQCRPVLLALVGERPPASGRARRRLPPPRLRLLRRPERAPVRPAIAVDARGGARWPVQVDADIVIARQRGRDVAGDAGFSAAEATAVATRHLGGRPQHRPLRPPGGGDRHDRGRRAPTRRGGGRPGTPARASRDLAAALTEGYTTYGGLGLAGCRGAADDGRVHYVEVGGHHGVDDQWHRR